MLNLNLFIVSNVTLDLRILCKYYISVSISKPPLSLANGLIHERSPTSIHSDFETSNVNNYRVLPVMYF